MKAMTAEEFELWFSKVDFYRPGKDNLDRIAEALRQREALLAAIQDAQQYIARIPAMPELALAYTRLSGGLNRCGV